MRRKMCGEFADRKYLVLVTRCQLNRIEYDYLVVLIDMAPFARSADCDSDRFITANLARQGSQLAEFTNETQHRGSETDLRCYGSQTADL